MHDAYLARIQELKQKRKLDEETKRLAEQQNEMLRNFVKKPTFIPSPNSEHGGTNNDLDTSGFNLKRGSKQTSNRIHTPMMDGSVNEYDEDGEIVEKKIVYRPKTPEIHEDML